MYLVSHFNATRRGETESHGAVLRPVCGLLVARLEARRQPKTRGERADAADPQGEARERR